MLPARWRERGDGGMSGRVMLALLVEAPPRATSYCWSSSGPPQHTSKFGRPTAGAGLSYRSRVAGPRGEFLRRRIKPDEQRGHTPPTAAARARAQADLGQMLGGSSPRSRGTITWGASEVRPNLCSLC